jgi:hypothetical protein
MLVTGSSAVVAAIALVISYKPCFDRPAGT